MHIFWIVVGFFVYLCIGVVYSVLMANWFKKYRSWYKKRFLVNLFLYPLDVIVRITLVFENTNINEKTFDFFDKMFGSKKE